MPLLCIDIGNTHVHYGVVSTGQTLFHRDLPTRLLEHPSDGLGPVLERIVASQPDLEGAAFCSVVPAATNQLRRVFELRRFARPLFQLTPDKHLGVPLNYPKPQEIGQDRLANAAGAQAYCGAPAIVIDLGTAVTFDIITRSRGYEGGIIAPGLDVMRHYLHEQTALLPLLDDTLEVSRVIGQSTAEAMRIGTVIGFGGMIQALLDAVMAELARRGEPLPKVLATGGGAALLQRTLRHPFTAVPDLTLRGLAAAWRLNAPPG
ncbi:MAG TPA: type III pantothenate kinase [Opitutaceae bacterium]|nr:type III pantothenate kinase [Opitutaceae bacterium]